MAVIKMSFISGISKYAPQTFDAHPWHARTSHFLQAAYLTYNILTFKNLEKQVVHCPRIQLCKGILVYLKMSVNIIYLFSSSVIY